MQSRNKRGVWLCVILTCATTLSLWIVSKNAVIPDRVALRELFQSPQKYEGHSIRITGRIHWAHSGGREGKFYIPFTENFPSSITGYDYRGLGFGGGPEYACKVFEESVAMPNPKVRYAPFPKESYKTGISARLVENPNKDFEAQ